MNRRRKEKKKTVSILHGIFVFKNGVIKYYIYIANEFSFISLQEYN